MQCACGRAVSQECVMVIKNSRPTAYMYVVCGEYGLVSIDLIITCLQAERNKAG